MKKLLTILMSLMIATALLGQPISGTYTINSALPTGGTNFISFTDLATTLNTSGIDGALIVNVVAGSGPYNEQVMFDTVVGTSAVNTITINGNGETLQYLSTESGARYTFALNGTDYVTIDNLTFEALGANGTSAWGWAVWLTNEADYNTFTNCTFIANTTETQTNYAAFVSSSSPTGATTAGIAASNLTIQNCTSIGGYYGMVINGPTISSGDPPAQNNVITNNEIKDFRLYGLYLRGQNNAVISENEIFRANRAEISTSYMIYLTQDMSGTEVTKNRVSSFSIASSTSTAYGIYATTLGANVGEELLIANNLIYGYDNMNGTQYGIYLSTSSGLGNVKVYHNTVSLDNTTHTGSSLIRVFYHSGATATLDVRNNIFAYTSNSSGTKYCLYFNTNTATVTSNNNVLYAGATDGTNYTGRWDGTDYITLADWQLAGFDANSNGSDPLFTLPANGDMTPQNPDVDNIGADLLAVVPDDFFGVARTATPDPGAIEFSPPACVPVSNIEVNDITTTTAEVSWAAGGTETLWNIKYGLLGFDPITEGTLINGVTVNPYIITGLDPATFYDVYVQADCGSGDLSSWSGPASFVTGCVPFNVPVFENFDNAATPQLPVCWDKIVYHPTSTFPYVETSSFTSPFSLPNHVRMYNSSSYNADAVLMLISPQIIDPINTLEVVFMGKSGSSATDLLIGTMSSPVDTNSFTLIDTIPLTSDYTQYTVMLDSYVGTHEYIAFKHGNDVSTRYIYLDDIEIREIPSCISVSDVTASNITTTTADIGWTPGQLETSWNIKYGAPGFDPETEGTLISGVTVNPYTITDLIASTPYDVYVQADCGGGDLSFWSLPASFNTACETFTVYPYTEGFEDQFPPLCWNYVNGVSGSYWEQSSVSVNTGSFAARAYQGVSSSYLADEWLITPAFDLDQASEIWLRFYGYSNQTPNLDKEKMRIIMLDQVYDNVADLHLNGVEIDVKYFTQTWDEYMVDLSTYTGVKYFAFNYYITENVGFNYVYIDDVEFFIPPQYYTVNFSVVGTNGTISAEVDGVAINNGDDILEESDVLFTATPDVNYQIKEWKVDGVVVPGHVSPTYTLVDLQDDVNVTVEFEMITHAVTFGVVGMNGALEAAVNGTPILSGDLVNQTSDVVFTAIPDQDYRVKEWKLDGVVVPDYTDPVYTVQNLMADVDVTVEFEEIPIVPGDVNGDGVIDVLDVTSIVAYIMGQNPDPFIFGAADVNGDGEINVLDIILTVNIILNGDAKASEVIRSLPADLFLGDGMITLKSDGTLAGLQFEIHNWDRNVSNLQLAIPGFEFVYSIEGNTLKGIVFNLHGNVLQQGSIELLSFEGKSDELQWGSAFAGNLNADRVKVNTRDRFSNLQEMYEVAAYPNPTRDHFVAQVYVPMASRINLKAIDASGNEHLIVRGDVVETGSYRYNSSVIGSLPPGTYILQLNAQPVRAPRMQVQKEIRVVIL